MCPSPPSAGRSAGRAANACGWRGRMQVWSHWISLPPPAPPHKIDISVTAGGCMQRGTSIHAYRCECNQLAHALTYMSTCVEKHRHTSNVVLLHMYVQVGARTCTFPCVIMCPQPNMPTFQRTCLHTPVRAYRHASAHKRIHPYTPLDTYEDVDTHVKSIQTACTTA